MNLIMISAKLGGETTTANGLRVLQITVPLMDKKGSIMPLYLVPSMAAGETFGAFAEGSQILINGRLYPNRNDGKMYVVPNQPLQGIPKEVSLNQVCLAGGIGYINDPKMDDLFECSIMVKGPSNNLLNHSWSSSMPFRLESWKDDAQRLKNLVYKGRQVAVGGVLRYSSWTAEDGTHKGFYSVRVRSSQYSVFGKNQAKFEEATQVETAPVVKQAPPKLPLQQDLAPSSFEANDDIPF